MESPILSMELAFTMADRVFGPLVLLCIPILLVFAFLQDRRRERQLDSVTNAAASTKNKIQRIQWNQDNTTAQFEKLVADKEAVEARLSSQEILVTGLRRQNELRKVQIKNCDKANVQRDVQLWDAIHTEIEKSGADYITKEDFDARIRAVTGSQVREIVNANISQGDVPRIAELEQQLALAIKCLQDTVVPALKQTSVTNTLLEQLVAKVDSQAITHSSALEKAAASNARLGRLTAQVDNLAATSRSALDKAAANEILLKQVMVKTDSQAATYDQALEKVAVNNTMLTQLTAKVDSQATTYGLALKEAAANSTLLDELKVKVDGHAATGGILEQLIAKINEHAVTEVPVRSPDYTSPAFDIYRTPLSPTPEEDYPQSVVMLQPPLENLSFEGIPTPSPPKAYPPSQESLPVEAIQGPEDKGNAEVEEVILVEGYSNAKPASEVTGGLTSEGTREVNEVVEEEKEEISAANTEAAVEEDPTTVQKEGADAAVPEISAPKSVMAEVTEATPAREMATTSLVQVLDPPAALNTPSPPEAIPTPPTPSDSPREPWTQSELVTKLSTCSFPTHAVEEFVAIPVAGPSPCHEIQMADGENSLVQDAVAFIAAATAITGGAAYQPASFDVEMGVTDDGTDNVEMGGMGYYADHARTGGTDGYFNDAEMGGTDDSPIGAEDTGFGDILMSDDNDGGSATITGTNLFNVPAFHNAVAAIPATPASNADGMGYEPTEDGKSDEGAGVDSTMEDVSATESMSLSSVMNPVQYSQPPQLSPLPFLSGFPSSALSTQWSNAPPIFGSIYTNLPMNGNVVAAIPQSSQGGWIQQQQQVNPQQQQQQQAIPQQQQQQQQVIPQQQQQQAITQQQQQQAIPQQQQQQAIPQQQQQQAIPQQQQQQQQQVIPQQQQQQAIPQQQQQSIGEVFKKRKQIEFVDSTTLKKQRTKAVDSTTANMSQVDGNALFNSSATSIQFQGSVSSQGFTFNIPGISYPIPTAQDDSMAKGKGKASASILDSLSEKKPPFTIAASVNLVSPFQSGSQGSSSSPIPAAQNGGVVEGKGKAAASAFDSLPKNKLPFTSSVSANLASPFQYGSQGFSSFSIPAAQTGGVVKGKGKAAASIFDSLPKNKLPLTSYVSANSASPFQSGSQGSSSSPISAAQTGAAVKGKGKAVFPPSLQSSNTGSSVTASKPAQSPLNNPPKRKPANPSPAPVSRETGSGTTGFLTSVLGSVEGNTSRSSGTSSSKVASVTSPRPGSVAGGSSSNRPKTIGDPKKLLRNIMVIDKFSAQDTRVISRLMQCTSPGPLRDRIVEGFWGPSARLYKDKSYITEMDVRTSLDFIWEEASLNRVRTTILEYIEEHGDNPQIQKFGADDLELLKNMKKKGLP